MDSLIKFGLIIDILNAKYKTMKKTLLILLLLPLLTITSTAQEKRIKSKVVSATVYSQGAQITRTAKLILDKGENRVVFTNLPPSIDESSIQVSCSDAIIVSVSSQKNMLDSLSQSQEFQKLLGKKKELEKKIKLEQALLQIIDTERDVLLSNKKLVGDQGVKLEDLKNSLIYFKTRLEELERSRVNKEEIIAGLEEDLNRITQQIATQSSQTKTETKEFLVTFKTDNPVSTSAEIKYFTSAAGWYPTYDIRASKINEPLTIQYKGNIYQNTGEKWEKIKLVVSSGNPTNNGTAPQISPWYLDYNNYGPYRTYSSTNYPPTSIRGTVSGTVTSSEDGMPIPGVSVIVKGTNVGCVTDLNGNYRITLPSNASALTYTFVGMKTQVLPISSNYMNVSLQSESLQVEELVVTALGVKRGEKATGYAMKKDVNESIPVTKVDYQTSFTFIIDMPYDIPSTGQPICANLNNFEVPSIYRYFSIPKLQSEAFLESRITNWEQFNLLDGEANLYFEDKFVGKSILEVSTADDTLNLSLGKDESVTIKRTKLQSFKEKNLIGTKRSEKREFEIAIRNNKKEPIDLLLKDQIPVTTNEEIKIKDVNEAGATLNSKTGILEWELKLQPGETKKIKFSYTVEYQSGKTLTLE